MSDVKSVFECTPWLELEEWQRELVLVMLSRESSGYAKTGMEELENGYPAISARRELGYQAFGSAMAVLLKAEQAAPAEPSDGGE